MQINKHEYDIVIISADKGKFKFSNGILEELEYNEIYTELIFPEHKFYEKLRSALDELFPKDAMIAKFHEREGSESVHVLMHTLHLITEMIVDEFDVTVDIENRSYKCLVIRFDRW